MYLCVPEKGLVAFSGFSTMFVTQKKAKKHWLECREGKQLPQAPLEENTPATATLQSNLLIP